MNFKSYLGLFLIFLLVFSSFANLAGSKTIFKSSVEESSLGVNYRAVIFGIGDYNGDGDYEDDAETYGYLPSDLGCTIPSAEAFRDALDRGTNHYSKDILFDEDATKSKVTQSITNKLINQADSNDISIIYYCGHGKRQQTDDATPGVRENGESHEEYLFLYDDRMGDPNRYRDDKESHLNKFAFRDDLFIDLISQIQGYVILILDSCYCSGFRADLDLIYDDIESEAVVLFTVHSENQALKGNSKLQRAYFSLCMISGLGENTDDFSITIDEIYNTAKDNYEIIKDMISLQFQGVRIYPNPGSSDYDVINDLVILEGINNERPRIDDFEIFQPRKRKYLDREINGVAIDPEDSDLEIYIHWGDHIHEWKSYGSGDEIEEKHTYPELIDNWYRYYTKGGVIIFDEYEAFTAYSLNVRLEEKAKSKVFEKIRINRIIERLLLNFN